MCEVRLANNALMLTAQPCCASAQHYCRRGVAPRTAREPRSTALRPSLREAERYCRRGGSIARNRWPDHGVAPARFRVVMTEYEEMPSKLELWARAFRKS